MQINEREVINSYENGESMNSIAKEVGTFANTIRRILQKNHITLRGDSRTKGSLRVKNGEELIEWAKAQGRPVTKAELAKIAGTKKLSPSYFEKYPELGRYVVTKNQDDLQPYYDSLYKWLQENNIPYKPNDRTKTKTSIDALLLGEYLNIALQIAVKPRYVSYKDHTDRMNTKRNNATSAGLSLIFLYHEDFVCLDNLKQMLEALKRK